MPFIGTDGVVALTDLNDAERKPRNQRPHNRAYLNERRVKLRKRLTPAEIRLWKFLQGSWLEGRKFRRQHSIGNYIVDFYCPLERLAIELDGQVHHGDLAEHLDVIRTKYLNELGVKVLRFENHFVFDEPEYVLARIEG